MRTLRNIPHNPAGNARGQALVELAFLLPVILLILIGSIEFGRAFYYKVRAINAAREAARLLVVTPSLTNANKDAISGLVAIRTNYGLVNLQIGSPANPTTLANSPAVTGDSISAIAFKGFSSIVPNFPPFNQLPNRITGSATMRYE
jgi:Flp pilus assembly protein TadG